MGPMVAFLVPMYQSEKTISRCLDSILRQTVGDFEAVIVDDGSADSSADIVREVASRDSRVRLIRNAVNRGVAHSLNVGLGQTDAEFIARLDADDEAHPTRLAHQLTKMRSSSDLGVCGSFVTYMGRTAAQERIAEVPVENHEIQAELSGTTHCPFYHPSVMFRRSVVVGAGGYREFFANAEDYDLWLRLSTTCAFSNIAIPLTRYRLSVGGATLPRVREQRLYALLAKRSAAMPGRDLADLWTDLTAAEKDADMAAYLRKEYRHFAADLADLGYQRQAFRLLLGARGDVGLPTTARFAAGRMKAALWGQRR